MQPNRQLFDEQRHRRFGRSNPERMHLAHWEWMVREGIDPYQLRERLKVPHEFSGGADWCFSRMGATETRMPDDRAICIGGEHEDFYDPDFCIYNDVIVRALDGGIEIYGYPENEFPPTDFHTATLVDDRITIIGRLGYAAARTPRTTPVYVLDCASYRISQLETSGECPGWVFNHESELTADHSAIIVRKGDIVGRNENEPIRKNLEEFRLRLADGRWEKITDHSNWRQFVIQRADGTFFQSLDYRDEKVLLPRRVPFEVLATDKDRTQRLNVRGVPIHCVDELMEVRVVVEGPLPDEDVQTLLEDIEKNLKTATRENCRVVEL